MQSVAKSFYVLKLNMSTTSGSTIENVIIAIHVLNLLKEKELRRKRRRRSIWVKRWINRRFEGNLRGELSLVHNEIRLEDPYSFRNYLRMNEECFNIVLSKIEGKLNYMNTQFRQCVSIRDRLTVTLRYLATGDSFQSMSYHFRLGRSTICKIVPEVLEAICECMQEENIKFPVTANEWNEVEQIFRNKWNFPNCCGALDGKHINFLCPKSEGSFYRNYKGTDSIVLMAIVDGNYKFLCVDIGANGRVSDGGVFRDSLMSKYINKNKVNLPDNIPLPGTNVCTPYVFVGDEAFPLTTRLMKPFSYHGLSKEKKNYNYRVSRARRVVENAFGILANRFRVLLNPIHLSVQKVELITTVCCVLHNFLISSRGNYYTDFEEDIQEPLQQLQSINRNITRGNRTTQNAINLRNTFVEYFNNTGSVSWQEEQ